MHKKKTEETLFMLHSLPRSPHPRSHVFFSSSRKQY